MSDCVWLLRHGDTSWTERELHTGLADPPLSDAGRREAQRAGRLLRGERFERVLVSPQARALESCRLAGFADGAERVELLVEWDYGELEGRSDADTHAERPGWNLFRDGAPGGESPEDVARRGEQVLARLRTLQGRCLVVGHGKFLRALAALWIGAPVALAAALPLDPAAISVLEHEHGQPLLRRWNQTGAGT